MHVQPTGIPLGLQLLAVRRLIRFAAFVAGALQGACGAEPSPGGESDLEIGRRYVEDAAFRRDALERSLAVPDGTDAELRLAHYAVPGEWDDLPEHDPVVRPAGSTEADRRPAWSGDVEWSEAALVALGRDVFELWPAQGQGALAAVIDSPARARAVGLWMDERAWVGGVVWEGFRDGSERPAFTCASCHARVGEDGVLVHGPASSLDVAALLSPHAPADDSGVGRVDVTPDGLENPVSIPDLRAVRHQRRLHWSGNLHNGLAALAVRIETLLITANSEVTRPPREVAFALALYLRSLGAEPRAPDPTAPGRAQFERACAGCHSGATGEGEPVDVAVVGTDPAVAESPARGSGKYRVPSLHLVTHRSRLTHEGRFESVEALLDPVRAGTDGAHPFGLDLDDGDRAALVAYLRQM